MDRTITCPSCFQQLLVAESQWNQPMTCPHCRQPFRPDDMQIQAAPAAPRPPTRPRDEFVQEEPSPGWVAEEVDRGQRWPPRSPFLLQPKSLGGLSIATVVLLGLAMLVDVAVIPVDLSYIRFLDLLIRYPDLEDEEMASGRRLEQVLTLFGVAQSVLTIATAVVFLTWLARAYGNLTALGAQGLDYSPGWAVGYYFIPILNLFRPCQVMQQTWRASDPAYALAQPRLWKQAPGSAVVGMWWAFWLITNIASQVSTRINLNPQSTLQAFKIASLAAVVSSIAALFAGGFLIFVVLGLTARQKDKFHELQAGEPGTDSEAQPR